MTETSTADATETVRLNWGLIEQRCADLGAHTSSERAQLLGVGRASLYRWRDGNDITLARAVAIARKLGLELQQIVPMGSDDPPPPPPTNPPAGPRPPAGPPAPRPPAGPPRTAE